MEMGEQPTPPQTLRIGEAMSDDPAVMLATEADALLDGEEARVRGRLAGLESGGIVGPVGGEEHLLAAEMPSTDAGAELTERALELGLLQSLRAELDAVDRARERLRSGAFGRCRQCGEAIDVERLRAIPTAEWCVQHS